ncbi:hypothetical protein GOBAR_AA27342 [Gossypium barbadense]|uniref:Uncharacterized protein n=1 Tax=Gossypium barbadense TaxID=3634 RepID=A0A2P5WQH2_GOSBA|nr:hypothetical protein GOBAR_AA27342 [Gossypium barbadense]
MGHGLRVLVGLERRNKIQKLRHVIRAVPTPEARAINGPASPPTSVPPLTPRSPQKRLSCGHQCTNRHLPRFESMTASPATEIFASYLQEKETNSRYAKKQSRKWQENHSISVKDTEDTKWKEIIDFFPRICKGLRL